VNRVPLSLCFVIAQLVVAALLIAVPPLGVHSSGDVCNAPSNELQDQWDSEKTSAAKLVLVGALVSFAAAITAFLSVSGRTRKGKVLFISMGMLGLVGVVVGLGVAFVTAAVYC
jgi:hypothetical protein